MLKRDFYNPSSNQVQPDNTEEKGKALNTQPLTEVQLELSSYSINALDETTMLAGWGFNPQEIASLLWLRQWYQTGGSDRASMVRHLEFLKMLVQSGELEL
jgi:hypothetical protein